MPACTVFKGDIHCDLKMGLILYVFNSFFQVILSTNIPENPFKVVSPFNVSLNKYGEKVILGSLEISNETFNGYTDPETKAIVRGISIKELYDQLKSVQKVHGKLIITANNPQFTNLSFLEDLKDVNLNTDLYSTDLDSELIDDASIIIRNTSLEYLGLKSLVYFSKAVIIQDNKHLCVSESEQFWRELTTSYRFIIKISGNKLEDECKCDSQCGIQGCWGPGPRLCRFCKNYKRDDTCVEKCDDETEFASEFLLPSCLQCHDLCKNGCYGRGITHCKKCKYFKRNLVYFEGQFECTHECEQNEYVHDGVCEICHENCIGGCFGPGETESPDGCKTCQKPIFYSKENKSCLNSNETCPKKFYVKETPLLDGKLKYLLGRQGCFPCHDFCLECTDYGFNNDVCQSCIQEYENCSCKFGFYYNETSLNCQKCSEECDGCTYLGVDNCINCKGFRFYNKHDSSPNVSFVCVDKCPQSYSYDQYLHQNYCSTTNLTNISINDPYGKFSVTYLEAIVLLVCLLLIVLSVWLWIRGVTYKNDLKIKQFLEDEEPLLSTNVAPNLNKLKIVKETDVKKTEILGSGAFGTVYRGIWVLEEGKIKVPVAVKVLNPETDEISTKDLLKEASVMAGFNHPHLLRLLAVCITSNLMLITQLLPYGDLLHYLRNKRNRIQPKSLLVWGKQIAQGMDYLEEHRLVHRDLAARNVLIQNKNNVKVTDFGLARALRFDQEAYASRGGKLPVKWMSLEAIKSGLFTHKSDVWSFGIVVWEMLTFGEEPYKSIAFECLVKYLESGERLPQPDSCSSDLFSLLATCWAEQVSHRPTFHELVEHFKIMAQEPDRFIIVILNYNNSLENFKLVTENFYHEIDDISKLKEEGNASRLHEYENVYNKMEIEA